MHPCTTYICMYVYTIRIHDTETKARMRRVMRALGRGIGHGTTTGKRPARRKLLLFIHVR